MVDENLVNEEFTEEELEDEVGDDEIGEDEEGFVEGYEGLEDANCANCGKPLEDMDEVVEEEFNGKIRRFCSNYCAEEFERKSRE